MPWLTMARTPAMPIIDDSARIRATLKVLHVRQSDLITTLLMGFA